MAEAVTTTCISTALVMCREDEFRAIFLFAMKSIVKGLPGCMYISGVPGTGKSSVVLEATKRIADCAAKGQIPDFKIVKISGLQLSDPSQVYVSILKQLTGQKATAKRAAALTKEYFHNYKADGPVLLIADEIDMLWNRKQTILYDIFNWIIQPKSKLIVLAVSNTMDLAERMVLGRVSSRIGLTKLKFEPYTHQQLEIIAKGHMLHHKFEDDAMTLAARKIAALSGDARRITELCQKAVDVAHEAGSETVRTCDVLKAVEDLSSSPMTKAIRACSFDQKLFLRALLAQLNKQGEQFVMLNDVIYTMLDICKMDNIDYSVYHSDHICLICFDLISNGILVGKGDGIHKQLQLVSSQFTVEQALKE